MTLDLALLLLVFLIPSPVVRAADLGGDFMIVAASSMEPKAATCLGHRGTTLHIISSSFNLLASCIYESIFLRPHRHRMCG